MDALVMIVRYKTPNSFGMRVNILFFLYNMYERPILFSWVDLDGPN